MPFGRSPSRPSARPESDPTQTRAVGWRRFACAGGEGRGCATPARPGARFVAADDGAQERRRRAGEEMVPRRGAALRRGVARRRGDGAEERRRRPKEGAALRRGTGAQGSGRRSGEGVAPKGGGGAQEREWRQREGAALRRGTGAKGRGRRSEEETGSEKAMVPRRRLELPRPLGHRYLKPARLPVPPPGHTAEAGAVAPRPGCVNAGPISCAPLRA
jgi:hypothetical protein